MTRRAQSSGRAAAIVAVGVLLAGCGSTGGSPDGAGSTTSLDPSKPVIVTDMYPTTFAIESVAGDAVQVVQLTPTGVEPHDYELTPAQVQLIADADLVAYLPGMIPAVEEAIAQEAADRALDITADVTRIPPAANGSTDGSAIDPHVWLDPTNMAVMGVTAAGTLTAQGITADPAPLGAEMAELDGVISTALAPCRIDTMVVSHEAFGYLAATYGFTQRGISGLSPEAEPSPARLVEITDLVRAEGITTIYFEALVSPESAETIAAETGVRTALLDPIEGATDGRTYPELMTANMEALAAGQDCA